MFVPSDYRPPDPAWVTSLIIGNPLAILCTSVPGASPAATHVPTIPQGQPDRAGLVGSVILGHMNRLNPHWDQIQSGGPALLIYAGPDSYVSPTIYQLSPAAPTWDFTAAHVRGSLAVINDREETLSIVKQTVATYERSHGTGWDMSESLGYFRQLLPGVGAFRLVVEKVEAMFKLSQEQQPEVCQRVIDAFAAAERTDQRCLAELMRQGGRR